MKPNQIIENLPLHIGLIMDGNGRWAKQHNLPRKLGHKQGLKALENILDVLVRLGIKYVSVFAFSTENSRRPADEVEGLKRLMEDNITRLSAKLIKRGFRLMIMGDINFFSIKTREKLLELIETSKNGQNGAINFGLNYGSRAEIVSAVNRCVREGREMTETDFSSVLYTSELPDPDLIIRTGGEIRLSNFMLYQSAYSELYFTDCLWPNFDEEELMKCLEDYNKRNRRFGNVQE